MKISVSFKRQDMWVGIFSGKGTKYEGAIYITLIPMFPIEIRWKESPSYAWTLVTAMDMPEVCPTCNTTLQKKYFTTETREQGESGIFVTLCTGCGRTWRTVRRYKSKWEDRDE